MHQKAAITLYPNTPFIKSINKLSDHLYEDKTIEGNERKGIAQLFAYLLRPRIKKS